MKNKILALLLALAVVLSFAPMSFAATSMIVNVDGVVRAESTQLVDGRTYIALGGLETYGLKTKIENDKIEMSNADVVIRMEIGSNKVAVNKAEMTIDAAPYLYQGTAYIPYRFLVNTLGYDVSYDGVKKQVVVKTVPAPTFPVVVKDGELSYTFEKEATRIVSLAPSVTEVLFAIGAGDKVVGRTDYCKFPESVSALKSVGTLYKPNLELIVDLKPDAVVAASHMNEDILKTLSDAKIAIATNQTPKQIDGIYEFIRSMGAVTGRFYESRALISSMESKAQRVQAVVAKIPQEARKKVYYVVGTGEYGEFTAGKDTYMHDLLTRAGLFNVAQDVEGWSYSLEKLIEHDPEYLIGGTFMKDSMNVSANHKALSALNNGKFVEVDDSVITIPGPRVFDYSVRVLLEKLYPEYAKNLKF
ncbi:MAG: helical backbone metal receptor [Bacillota bacterium]|nr:helical backbone metal receptor [Bacillota bacterium]